ncbi:MAG: N-6 DNA methylase [Bacterioplanes sp.]|nr:N-6 DNA methylase [Bacterioplanes sp.]
MQPHSKDERKALGAYYTPSNLSQVLCDWAIKSPDSVVLEPSFGGCGFLETSVVTLKALGCKNPEAQLYGADIDEKAFDFLSDKLGRISDISNRFICRDFIQTSRLDFGDTSFDVAIGNPPYVSMHNMSEQQRISCQKILKASPFADKTIGINTSLWAFFLLHTLSFLKNGARTAWVLPSSALHADYARALLSIYEKHFETVKVVKLNQRFFQSLGADEVSVILLAESFSETPSIGPKTQYAIADDLDTLRALVLNNNATQEVFSDNYKHSIMSSDVLRKMLEIQEGSSTKRLGEIGNVVIGMVTGDNKTFVISKKEAEDFNLGPDVLKPVIGRFSQLKGLIHTPSRHKKLENGNSKCLLVCPRNVSQKPSPIRSYLATVDRKKRHSNRTFVKRPNWFYPDDGRYPDAFLSYMLDKSPRLVINASRINCTNSVHRVFFTGDISYENKKAIAASFLSSYSQLSAEIAGRSYGSGVLKLEPTAAKSISIFASRKVLKKLSTITGQIDKMLSKGLLTEAQELVDEAICNAEGISREIFHNFARCAEEMRKDRYKGLRRSDPGIKSD